MRGFIFCNIIQMTTYVKPTNVKNRFDLLNCVLYI